MPESDEVGAVKGASNVATSDERESLHSLKVGMLDAHNASFRKQTLWPVVDELSVDEAVDSVLLDLLHLGLHLLPLRPL